LPNASRPAGAEAQRLGLAADVQAALTSGLVGGSGVTQGQIRTRLPKIRPNVVGRIVEAAATKGAVIKAGEGTTAKYYRPAATETERVAA
jgi:hypothetical protein